LLLRQVCNIIWVDNFMKEKILFIEDEKDLQMSLRIFFLEKNFQVQQAYSGAEGLKKIEDSVPDIIVLDLGLPDIQGEVVCQQIKTDYPNIPVIILTAKNTPKDIVTGLGMGADDYVPKPFDLEELLARIKARLHKNGHSSVLEVADLKMDLENYEVARGDKKIILTPTEFSLLEYLIRNRDHVVTRDSILNRVWSYESDVQTRVVDVYIGYLRKKIDKPFKNKLIHNVRGFGYTIKTT